MELKKLKVDRIKHLVTLWLSYNDQHNYLEKKCKEFEFSSPVHINYQNIATDINNNVLNPLREIFSREGVVWVEVFPSEGKVHVQLDLESYMPKYGSVSKVTNVLVYDLDSVKL